MITEKILFKESLFHMKYKGDIDTINKHIEHILFFDKGRQKTNQGGFQSHDITFGFQELLSFLEINLKQFSKKLKLSNFWLNINKGNDYNLEHIHELDGVSVVYYHQVCCDKSPIYFKHLCPQLVTDTEKFYPKDQDIIVFPSYLPHGVESCGHQEHKRISFAFNYKHHE